MADDWLALQFDNAVSLVGRVIEGAAQEQVKMGTTKEPRWEPKYSMDQLLDPQFRLPAPKTKEQRNMEAFAGFKALVGVKTVRG